MAVATAKLDGLFFALGVLFGIFGFGETVEYIEGFFESAYFGRLTLMDGAVVLIVMLMALFMFWGAEKLEKIFGGRDLTKEPKLRYYGAGALAVIALVILLIGQPTPEQRWQAIADERGPLLEDERAYQIHCSA